MCNGVGNRAACVRRWGIVARAHTGTALYIHSPTVGSGSAILNAANISAVACRLRDHMMRSRRVGFRV